MRWRIGGDPTPVPPHGDEQKWRWALVDTFMGGLHTTYFAITRSALHSEELPSNVDRARATRGRSALERYLDCAIPPERIAADTTKVQAIGERWD